ncbi:hypothetical protein ANN_15872 [Periplaneta americana]|uniref:Uncharacterized protein n=1 Tax=Periplaneta americana TaxID=6978 RepID=A0ABQ8SHM6_PERAM|nr:hypothetical protein ANN_15872 [Periplaneta americana]
MKGLCEGSNEPPGSLKARKIRNEAMLERVGEERMMLATAVAQSVKVLACRPEVALGRGCDPAWADYLTELITHIMAAFMFQLFLLPWK